jgi:hypothetical protein
MSFDINNFTQKLEQFQGLTLASKYVVRIIGPAALGNGLVDLEAFCESAVLPGRSFQVSEQVINSLVNKVAVSNLYNPISLGFYSDGKQELRKYFEAWQGLISDPITGRMNYYETYAKPCMLVIGTFGQNGALNYLNTAFEAYPLIIEESIMSSSLKNEILRLNVTFQIKYHYGLNVGNVYGNQALVSQIFNSVANVAGIINAISQGVDGLSIIPIQQTAADITTIASTLFNISNPISYVGEIANFFSNIRP